VRAWLVTTERAEVVVSATCADNARYLALCNTKESLRAWTTTTRAPEHDAEAVAGSERVLRTTLFLEVH